MRLLLILSLLMAACSTPQQVYDPREDNARHDFERAIKMMDEERHAEAGKILNKILVETPATEFDFVVLYNLGASNEAQKKCNEAAENYRAVARAGRKFLRLEAMALLRLGYAYECMGQDDKALIALLDAKKRAGSLPEDTARTELPARLAAAYARAGNRPEAEKYFKEALKGIKHLQVKHKDSRVLGDTLAETFYFMGLSHISEADFLRNPISQIKGLELMQIYLLQAAELGSAKWSGRAVDEILGNYARIWRFGGKLQVPDSEDQSIKTRAERDLRAEVFKQTLQTVRVLRAQRLPSRQESSDVQRLFSRLEAEERKLVSILSEMGFDTRLTPQAEKRQGLKAPGRVKDTKESPLEIEAKKRATLPPKRK